MAYATISKPELQFNTKLYTGNGGTQALTGVGFQPDWVWIKARSIQDSHQLYDIARGVTKGLRADTAGNEATVSNGLTAFGTDGFTVGDNSKVNQNSATYVAWNWKANNGTGASNSSGTISSTVYANTTAGFNMVKYVGNGTAGATVGHGLGSAPEAIILKDRDTNGAQWTVYHQGMGATKAMQLDTTTQAGTNILYWNNTAPTSTVFSLGAGGDPNGNTKNYIAYCFKGIKGYSKFGTYIGNGNADGPFVYTGFKPAWIMGKSHTHAGNWFMWDNKRPNEFNLVDHFLEADGDVVEYTNNSNHSIDIYSNGFKFRGASGSNGDGKTAIYFAFAEEPLVANVGSNGVPATAR